MNNTPTHYRFPLSLSVCKIPYHVNMHTEGNPKKTNLPEYSPSSVFTASSEITVIVTLVNSSMPPDAAHVQQMRNTVNYEFQVSVGQTSAILQGESAPEVSPLMTDILRSFRSLCQKD